MELIFDQCCLWYPDVRSWDEKFERQKEKSFLESAKAVLEKLNAQFVEEPGNASDQNVSASAAANEKKKYQKASMGIPGEYHRIWRVISFSAINSTTWLWLAYQTGLGFQRPYLGQITVW